MTNQEVIRDMAQAALDQIKSDERLYQMIESRIQADPILAAGKAAYDAVWTQAMTLDEVNEAAELYWQGIYKPTLVQVRLDVVRAVEALCKVDDRPFAGPLNL